MKDFAAPAADVVRVLPFGAIVRRRDFRIICECQRHAMRERKLWRRSLRAAKRHGVALAIGVPLIVGAMAFPTEAMNTYLPLINHAARRSPQMITRSIRDAFAAPPAPIVTLDQTRAEFFAHNVPYGAIIYREAKKNSLPPELVAAVVQAESDFRVRLVSGKDAKGLMQIVPETGRILHCDNPFDPEQNIVAGTKYLRYLCDRFGDERMALAAYNAGEGNIERFGGIPPFAETRDYVERVAHHTRDYRLKVRQRFLAASRIRTSVQQ